VDSVIVPFVPNDTLDDFEARVHAHEHKLIVRAVRQVLQQQANSNGD